MLRRFIPLGHIMLSSHICASILSNKNHYDNKEILVEAHPQVIVKKPWQTCAPIPKIQRTLCRMHDFQTLWTRAASIGAVFGLGLLAGIRNGGYFFLTSSWCVPYARHITWQTLDWGVSISWDAAWCQASRSSGVFCSKNSYYTARSNRNKSRLIWVLVCHFVLVMLNGDCSRFVKERLERERMNLCCLLVTFERRRRRVHGARLFLARKLNKGLLVKKKSTREDNLVHAMRVYRLYSSSVCWCCDKSLDENIFQVRWILLSAVFGSWSVFVGWCTSSGNVNLAFVGCHPIYFWQNNTTCVLDSNFL